MKSQAAACRSGSPITRYVSRVACSVVRDTLTLEKFIYRRTGDTVGRTNFFGF
jgi:hypothetical protein